MIELLIDSAISKYLVEANASGVCSTVFVCDCAHSGDIALLRLKREIFAACQTDDDLRRAMTYLCCHLTKVGVVAGGVIPAPGPTPTPGPTPVVPAPPAPPTPPGPSVPVSPACVTNVTALCGPEAQAAMSAAITMMDLLLKLGIGSETLGVVKTAITTLQSLCTSLKSGGDLNATLKALCVAVNAVPSGLKLPGGSEIAWKDITKDKIKEAVGPVWAAAGCDEMGGTGCDDSIMPVVNFFNGPIPSLISWAKECCKEIK